MPEISLGLLFFSKLLFKDNIMRSKFPKVIELNDFFHSLSFNLFKLQ